MFTLFLIGNSLWRAVRIAAIDLISTANGKALGAAVFERTDKPFAETFVKVLHDEALEPFWATTVSSMLAEIAHAVTPSVPEQIAIIPGKLLGEAWHWLITSEQSTNKENLATNGNGNRRRNKNGNGKNGNIFAMFFETFVKTPSELILKLCGLGKTEGNFFWYTLSQLGVMGLVSYSLMGDEEENLPGVNIDRNESAWTNIMRGLGYTIVEQATYAISQGARFYIDFSKEFKGKKGKTGEAIAKAMANLVNERLFPGHILLGAASAASTYLLSDIIPKTTAAAIGEFPMSILNRMLNCRNRRATKHVIEQEYDHKGRLISQQYKRDRKGNKVWNYRFNTSKAFNSVLDTCDEMLRAPKEICFDLITNMFRGDTDAKTFKRKLKESLDINLTMAA